MPRERKSKKTAAKGRTKPYKVSEKHKTSKTAMTIETTNEKTQEEVLRAIITNLPTLLHVTTTNDGIFITDSEQNTLHILDRNGNYKATIGGKGRKNKCYNEPTGVTSLSDGTIVVADSGNERLKFITDPAGKHDISIPFSGMPCLQSICTYKDQIYCTFGNMIRVVEKKKGSYELGRQFMIMEMDNDCETTGLAVNDHAIYISDSKTSRVYQIVNDSVSKRLKYHDIDEKIEPAGLAVDPDGNLLICNRAKNNILVFDPLMQIKTSEIPVNGKPRDLAFLDEDKLIVTYECPHGVPFEILRLG